MPERISDLKLSLDKDLEEHLQWLYPQFDQYQILKKSVDARRRHSPHYVYTLDLFAHGESPPPRHFHLPQVQGRGDAPLIVGAGPAGLFAALRLAERGISCHLFERGSKAEERVKAINRFWRYGELNPEDNVCFGEGGAGLYSDGKLITRIKSPYIPYVMNRLVQMGAPAEIEYLSNPHVGSDRIRRLIPKLRHRLEQLGVQIHYQARFKELILKNNQVQGLRLADGREFYSDRVLLACGHSAEDVFYHLEAVGVEMQAKPFAMGLRVEHPQSLINQLQYRQFAEHPQLGPANYKVRFQDKIEEKGVYSFCMCPGGYVLNSSTDEGRTVTNGMSNFRRNSPYANSALVVTVETGGDRFSGLHWRQNLETRAYQQVKSRGGHQQLPAQNLLDFVFARQGEVQKGSSLSGAVEVRWDQLLPNALKNPLLHALEHFGQIMPGFASEKAQLFGVESRTSCPVRIVRDTNSLQSTSHVGLYPVGEGAGYAGGITSAACDGITVAEQIASEWAGQEPEALPASFEAPVGS